MAKNDPQSFKIGVTPKLKPGISKDQSQPFVAQVGMTGNQDGRKMPRKMGSIGA